MNPRSYRIELYGIVNRCPFDQEIEDCPSAQIRTVPLEQRLQWARSLSEERVSELVEVHEKCYEQRLGNNEIPLSEL